jgi:hypothetical protein
MKAGGRKMVEVLGERGDDGDPRSREPCAVS